MKIFRDINDDEFLDQAFDAEANGRLVLHALQRRNIYLAFFLTGIVCVFLTSFMEQMVLSLLTFGLASLSLVVMTKYNTQLCFLRGLRLRSQEAMLDDDSVA